MMDASYWGREFGVVVIKDHISGNVVWHKFIERKECVDDYAEGVGFLKKEGYEIICVVGDGRSHCTHKNLRSAYLSLKRNMPYLWTCHDNYDLNIPNTNNGMESLFSWIKRKLKNHNGISLERRKMLISKLFSAHRPYR